MRDSDLIKERAAALLKELERYISEEDQDYVLTKIELAMLRAHIDTNTNVHTEDDDDDE
jgi:hypothetical protein